MMTLITGGHRAGKTTMALKIASNYSQKTYIATAEPLDDEMRLKIKNHQAERDESYITIEEPLELPAALFAAQGELILVDCLTMWVNNLLYYGRDPALCFESLCDALPQVKADIVLISNESSLCLIPGDKESRRYLNLLAEINRKTAALADQVCMMVSGLPLWLKERK